ncbi:neurotrimin [Eurytemora carolleeae]|uniref:neurotrimin n=1 Tax=Eurytemora carolleeae TaxID=1294199 RepID=UPI000C792CCA|nr:neurotrimin [Eurytemora carolleeae]|eukprot:XP_023330700.1 neurotrimin-like [Eurytemora affinis]
MRSILAASFLIFLQIIRGERGLTRDPEFISGIRNVSVAVGRDASLSCHISNNQGYKVAWIRIDTQTILTLNNHVITKNHRIDVSQPEDTEWKLDIKDVRPRDAGFYMCQVNTEPMKSKLGYLEVVEPPSIQDGLTSRDQIVSEGDNIVLACKATGHPTPQIRWRREDGKHIRGNIDKEYIGPIISLVSVSKEDMGAYLCIAQNGVPPAVSRRTILQVKYPPTVLLTPGPAAGVTGGALVLTCAASGFPEPVTSWVHNNRAIPSGGRFEIVTEVQDGQVITRLVIDPLTSHDAFSRYTCIGKNNLGSAEDSITLNITEARGNDDVKKVRVENEIIYKNPRLEIWEINDLPNPSYPNQENKGKAGGRGAGGKGELFTRRRNNGVTEPNQDLFSRASTDFEFKATFLIVVLKMLFNFLNPEI